MRAAGVRRLEAVSATLAEPHENWARYGALRAHVLFPILNRRFSATYDDMRRMEQVLCNSDADWTSYRPPYLTDRAGHGRPGIAIDTPLKGARSLARSDLAGTWTSEHQREKALETWNLHYNYHRPHGVHDGKPPASATPQRVSNVLASYI